MVVNLRPESDANVLVFQLDDDLDAEAYRHILLAVERAAREYDEVDLVFEVDAPGRPERPVRWRELEENLNVLRSARRVAMVGSESWHDWLAVFSRPFSAAETRLYTESGRTEALAWAGSRGEPRSAHQRKTPATP